MFVITEFEPSCINCKSFPVPIFKVLLSAKLTSPAKVAFCELSMVNADVLLVEKDIEPFSLFIKVTLLPTHPNLKPSEIALPVVLLVICINVSVVEEFRCNCAIGDVVPIPTFPSASNLSIVDASEFL